jgi:hypothetical protein
MYRSFAVWDRAEEGLYRYRVLENLLTGKFSVLMRDFFGTSPSNLKDCLRDFDNYFVELLAEESPESRSGAYGSVREAVEAFDNEHSETSHSEDN